MAKKKAVKKLWSLKLLVVLAMAGIVLLLVVALTGCAKTKIVVKPILRPVVASLGFEEGLVMRGQPDKRVHEVRQGDTLWGLAGREWGSPFHWPLIWKANRDYVVEPDWIEVGERLDIPEVPMTDVELSWAVGVAREWPKGGRARGEAAVPRP